MGRKEIVCKQKGKVHKLKNSPEEESMISISSASLKSFWSQTAYWRSENLEKPVVNNLPVSPK